LWLNGLKKEITLNEMKGTGCDVAFVKANNEFVNYSTMYSQKGLAGRSASRGIGGLCQIPPLSETIDASRVGSF